MTSPYRLPAEPDVPKDLRERVQADFDRFAAGGLPADLEGYLREAYQLDVATTYAGLPIRNPWGKASGQLSMTLRQVEEDITAGLGFVVLKTVIAEDAAGSRSMAAWAVQEARMVVEPITGQSGEAGWTVSWKGRGWWQPFGDYLALVREAASGGRQSNTLIVPSCKFHLKTPEETAWRHEEYTYTVNQLLDAYGPGVMPLEKDFSPTLAGSERSRQQAQILEWLDQVPQLIREAAGARPIRVGLKLFNTLFDDDFQVQMLERVHAASHPADFLIYGNRLFDPQREFEGIRGIAYGGPDLSDRNLGVLDRFRSCSPASRASPFDWSATGNICSGRMAVEYALRGCTSFQMHTLFQLPGHCYAMREGNKTQKALHLLYFHPRDGFIVWMHHLARRLDVRDAAGVIRFIRAPSVSAG